MVEPTSTAGVNALVLAISAATMALLGVDYYSLVWGMFGAQVALFQNQATMGRVRALVYVALSTLVGAAVGTGTAAFLASKSQPLLILVSLVGGFGAQKIVTALLDAGLARVKKMGGE